MIYLLVIMGGGGGGKDVKLERVESIDRKTKGWKPLKITLIINSQNCRPLGGSNPCYCRERAVS